MYVFKLPPINLLLFFIFTAYGRVFLVRKNCGPDSGTLYAMKVMPKSSVIKKRKTAEHTMTERQILEAVRDCAFMVTLHYAFQTDTKLHFVLGKLYIYLQYIIIVYLFMHSLLDLTCIYLVRLSVCIYIYEYTVCMLRSVLKVHLLMYMYVSMCRLYKRWRNVHSFSPERQLQRRSSEDLCCRDCPRTGISTQSM